MEQSEAESANQYVACSKCKLNFNDDEQLKTDFGDDRLNIRYKACVKCRKHNAEKKQNIEKM